MKGEVASAKDKNIHSVKDTGKMSLFCATCYKIFTNRSNYQRHKHTTHKVAMHKYPQSREYTRKDCQHRCQKTVHQDTLNMEVYRVGNTVVTLSSNHFKTKI